MINLPIEFKKENIFKRIKRIIKSIFIKKPKIETEILLNNNHKGRPNKVISELYKVNDVMDTDVVVNKKQKMQEIIDIIEKDPSVLKKLDIKKLQIIDNYYIEQIEIYKKKLAKAKKNDSSKMS